MRDWPNVVLLGDLVLNDPREFFGKFGDQVRVGRCLSGGDRREIDDETLTEPRYNVRVFVIDASFSERPVPCFQVVRSACFKFSVSEGTVELHERFDCIQSKCAWHHAWCWDNLWFTATQCREERCCFIDAILAWFSSMWLHAHCSRF